MKQQADKKGSATRAMPGSAEKPGAEGARMKQKKKRTKRRKGRQGFHNVSAHSLPIEDH